MRFNPKARLDTGRMSDAGRGGGGGGGGLGGGGGRIPIPGGLAGGGGILGVIVVIVFVAIQLLGGGGGGGGTGLPGGTDLNASRFTDTGRYENCKTGEDANNSTDCARVAVENSLTSFWEGELGGKFHPEKGITTFSGSIDTACGGATSAVGPFYCPTDETIYLDDTFFKDVLEGQLRGPAGAFVEPYVLAHEYGHHISNLIGTLGAVKGGTGPQSDGVRLELQADCFAGMWTKHATQTEDADGNVLIQELSQEDIDNALAAAKTVGDDYIQKRSGGSVDEESWTHGSSAQRQKWFNIGYTEGTMQACDTFGARTV
ncbi:KPN_02809 family neutral zinc metallopeptidase [Nocardioides sp. GXZ039]|uniref:KPN_02809 family neutral zinc metallopeptidase n=1 Tax=Nocardioides sp. GXZ039 TaxID=3136018 RepID=UPI0030F436EB